MRVLFKHYVWRFCSRCALTPSKKVIRLLENPSIQAWGTWNYLSTVPYHLELQKSFRISEERNESN